MRDARRAAWIAALLTAVVSPPLRAEIYQWTDPEGRVHFTESLDRVPPAQRAAAMRDARKEGAPDSPVQTFSAPAASPSASRGAHLARELRIPFQREGSLMRVTVRLNDVLNAPFYVDTGASGIALPTQIAERLGLHAGPETPQVRVSTANGPVLRPVFRLDSVELGGARVEGLEATLNPTMEVGLLGGTFFNNFVYRVDAAESVITLAPNEQMRGGLDASGWRARFRELSDPLARLDAHLAPENALPGSERELLERRRAELRAALDALELEANRKGVPQAWRQ